MCESSEDRAYTKWMKKKSRGDRQFKTIEREMDEIKSV